MTASELIIDKLYENLVTDRATPWLRYIDKEQLRIICERVVEDLDALGYLNVSKASNLLGSGYR